MTTGLSIVNTHNVWALDWTLIVTLFGWALVLGGVSRIGAPRVVDKVGGAMMGRPTMTRIVGAFSALLGAFPDDQGLRLERFDIEVLHRYVHRGLNAI